MSAANDYFYLGAYWGDRKENVDQCVDRLATCLERWAETTRVLGAWYHLRRRRREKAKRAPTDRSALRDLLLAGRSRTDLDGTLIEDLGFSMGLWNGSDIAPVGFGVSCGAFPRIPGLMNSVVLDLPSPGGGAADLFELSTALELVRSTVDCWQPYWAVLTSNAIRDAQPWAPREPYIGWLTYLSGDKPLSLARREGVSTAPMGEGTVIILAPSPAELSAEVAGSVREELERTGQLRQVPVG